jgi:lipoprotein-anchoring transpeptidase ErfK/SrfK
MSRYGGFVAVLALALVAGCGGASGVSKQAALGPPAPVLRVTPGDSVKDVRLDTPVAVHVRGGELRSVTVTPAGGHETLAGSADGGGWTSTATLAPSTSYRVVAEAEGPGGVTQTSTTFSTLAPSKAVTTKISPLDGQTVGVGLPVALYFSNPLKDHALVEQHLSVTPSQPVEGAWRWYGDSEVHWRPKDYWPTGTTVTVDVKLNGVDLGDGAWGVQDRHIGFTIGDSHVSIVDASTHQMQVFENGVLVRTMAVSTGRDKYPTKNGIHVVLAKEQKVVMDSATVGIPRNSPDGYYETVYWNTRISDSGEYVHSAPWSVGDQGRRNVSHGCVNASPADAEWFYGFSRRGDIVEVKGSPEPLQQGNGYADWNIPWEAWAGS